jgi:hypothetical protein
MMGLPLTLNLEFFKADNLILAIHGEGEGLEGSRLLNCPGREA